MQSGESQARPMLREPRIVITFLAGLIAGGLGVWICFGRTTILVPKDANLVEVSRLGGGAREIFVSRWDSHVASEAEEQKIEDRYQKQKAAPVSVVLDEAKQLSAEEFEKVRFSATVSDYGRSLSYEIYNESGKTLVSAEVRIEGSHDSGVPVGRTVRFDLPELLAPKCDLSGGANTGTSVRGFEANLKVTLVSVSGR